MENYGYLRVAAATPGVKLADPAANAKAIMSVIDDAEENKVSVLVFPELSVTGYTCGDLFGSAMLLDAADKAVRSIVEHTRGLEVTAVIGAPVRRNDKLYNCAIVIRNGQVKGIVPKIYLPDYGEFYESRWFASGSDFLSGEGSEGGISPNLLFKVGDATFAVEICEDLWTPVPPSSFHSVAGAEIILNLSASNEVLLKHSYRQKLVCEQSAHTLSAYVYCSGGYGESSQDLVYSASSLIYENGLLMAEAQRFMTGPETIYADIDVEKLKVLRSKRSTFRYFTPDGTPGSVYSGLYSQVDLGKAASTDLSLEFFRAVEPHPFVPSGKDLEDRCAEVIAIQVLGLARRLEHVKARSAVIGISGGLDSTLALIVTAMAFDRLNWPREGIIGVTMPGLGTSARTKDNAGDLMAALGITTKEISVVPAVEQHFRDIGHDPSVIDSVYENAQARERTQILMDISNQTGGIVVGTGDLSELALGWCTYNGDHMSMYAVNASVPKTLVRELCRYCAATKFQGGQTAGGRTAGEIILDIVDTPISPELTPAGKDGAIAQLTEDLIGPYELHDFFLYHFFRFGCSPAKILFLAERAFGGRYERKTLLKWLKVFFKRFFSQQFKRSCMPDGPKVGSVSLSPRGDWRMPSDACPELWLKEIESL